MDDFEREFPDFDWRETPAENHPRKCRCPKHEYIEERIRSIGLPFIVRLCPPHYKVYWETFDEIYDKLPTLQKFLYKAMTKLKWIKVEALKYMQSEMCFWCKFGTGGRGIKTTIAPDMP